MPRWHTVVVVVVCICWGIFVLVWIGGGVYNAFRAPHARRRSFGNSAWFLIALLIWLVARRVLGVEALSFNDEPATVRVIGAVLLVLATGFTLWARIMLGTMWSPSPVAKEHHLLRTAGPYAITRHPIYTGILGMMIGTAIALNFGVWVWVLVLVAVFFGLRIRSEEQLLSEAFPATYADYRRRVPQLIPGLRLRSRRAPSASSK